MSFFDTLMSDTVGVVYRAATGSVDPWTAAEMADQAGLAQQQAGGSYEAGYEQSQQATDSANATTVSWSQAAGSWVKSTVNDDGSGCSLISNPGGCFPSW